MRATFVFSPSCGKPLTLPSLRRAAAQTPPHPMAQLATRCSAQEIEEYLENQLREEYKSEEESKRLTNGCTAGSIGLLLMVLLPVGWPIFILIFTCLGIYWIGRSLFGFYFYKLRPDVQAKLKAMRYRWRSAGKTRCPICENEFYFTPFESEDTLTCPSCDSDLRHEGNYVWPL